MEAAAGRLERRDRAINIGLAVGFAGVIAGIAYQLAAEGRVWVFDSCVGVAVCGVALLRARHRAWTAVIGLAVSAAAGVIAGLGGLPGEPGTATMGLLVLGGSAVRALPPWQGLGVAVAGIAVGSSDWLAAGLETRTHGHHPLFGLTITCWLLALTVGLSLRLVDYRRRVANESARRDERLALARELHDVVAHHITGVVLQAQAAKIVARKRPETLEDTLTGIETAGTDALAAMRRVVGLLRDVDDVAPASAAPERLADLVRRFEGHGPAVRLDLPVDETRWPPEVTTTVYRIVQEALTNIARHAPHATTARVKVTREQGDLRIEIVDDATTGAYLSPSRGGFGLVGMRERVEALGGTLRVGPGDDAGWSVLATLPMGEHG